MSQNYSGRLAAILAVLFIALLAIFWPSVKSPAGVGFNPSVPFSQKINLKPGIDIKGGTSLLYEIKKADDQAGNTNLAQEMVSILKQRVDPGGLMNLIWRPHGSSQIEIQMPFSATSGETEAAQKQLDAARAALDATNIRVSDAIDAIEGKNGKTAADLDKMAAGSPERKKILDEMTIVYAALKKAQAEHDVPGGFTAGKRYEELKQALADTNLPPSKVEEIYTARGSRQAKLDDLKARNAGYPARAQALAAYEAAKDKLAALGKSGGSLESAADLKRALRGSGVLEFHILPKDSDADLAATGGFAGWNQRLQRDGPRYHQGDKFKWFEVQDPEEFKNRSFSYNDRQWVLASVQAKDSLDRQSGDWALTSAKPEPDQTGVLQVAFKFDTPGADKFGNLTRAHIGEPMAIMLDGQVISAPNIQSAITTGSGVITGGGNGFTQIEVDYLVRMLRAGSLPAQLGDEPISERTVGPQLGEDNLRAGLMSCGLGLLVVAVFLISYYYRAGVVAFGAIVLNIILILGCMVIVKATFTLPGIAAIVLTIGTSVDANVLVFERLREEQHRGLPLRMAMRNAYDRAFSAIVDSNMTTVITSVALILFGTEDVKGFGITLIIGIICSLFTALFVTRTVFGIMIDRFGVRQLGSIPLTFPRWDKLLKPHIDWMGMAWIFYAFSAVLITTGLALFFHYAKLGQMMDIEFAKGTSVTFELTKPQQQETVRKWIDDESRKMFAHGDALPSPSVQRIGIEGTTWEVTTPNADAKAVRAAILEAVPKDDLKSEQPSTFAFAGKNAADAMAGGNDTPPVIFPLTGDNLNDPQKWPGGVIPPNVKDKFGGGVAIVLRGLNPPLSQKAVDARIRRQLLQAPAQGQSQASSDLAAVGSREVEVFSPAGPDQPADTLVVLTADPNLSYDIGKVTDSAEKERQLAIWRDSLVAPLWTVINDAVSRPAELQQVKNFDASVAADTRKDALIALTLSVLVIMIYIWIRFGNLKYGTATVVALLHDVLFTIAALGFAHLLANAWIGDLLLLDPFRINMTVVAGILTIMGYSMIDTIVVFDRIRENRGKYGHVSRQVINDAVNQTLSRTLLTAGTTIIMVCIMYFLGGAGIHGFTFVLLVGILVGTYSSVAIAAPILLLGNEAPKDVPSRETPRSRAVGAT